MVQEFTGIRGSKAWREECSVRRKIMIDVRKSWVAALLSTAAVTLGLACSSTTADDASLHHDGTATETTNPDGGATPTTVKTTSGLPCDVNQILTTSCQTCHGAKPQTGASTSLVTWDDLQKDVGGRKLYEVVKDRVHADSARMPPAAPLSAPDLASIDAWVAAGAPKSDATCEGAPPPPAAKPFECAAPNKLTVLKAAQPFTWTDKNKSDQYMCYGVDELVDAKRHVIAFGPKVDNLDILHHILLFQSNTAMSNEATPCSAVTSTAWQLVTGWAPGGGNFELPPEAGVPEEGTTHWILQVHYNNASGKFNGATDDSGYQLCSTDQLRPNDAGFLAVGSINFNIPPRTAKHRIKCDYKLNSNFDGVTFFRAWPHMHKLGMALSTERLPGGDDTTPDPVFSQDPFSFENQESHPINLKPAHGDVLRTRCTWKNPGDVSVGFGENTEDEMCFDFLSYYPAIPSLGWVNPSLFASCTDED
jgi:hypothetical protein